VFVIARSDEEGNKRNINMKKLVLIHGHLQLLETATKSGSLALCMRMSKRLGAFLIRLKVIAEIRGKAGGADLQL
jgi:hypothetical protein